VNVLFITPRPPYPPAKGDQLVMYHRIRELSQRHRITLLSLVQRERDLTDLDEIRPWCAAVHTIHLPLWRSLLSAGLRAPISSLPLQALYYQSRRVRRSVGEVLRVGDFDLVHVCLLRLAPYVREADVPRVLELIDSMSLNLDFYSRLEPPPKRWLLRWELARVAQYEREVALSFDHCLVVSERDREALITATGDRERISVVPNGVDSELFHPGHGSKDAVPTIVFSGTMSYGPNVHALEWFVERCLPAVRAAASGVRLLVAGRNPSTRVRALGEQEGVVVLGAVPSMTDVLNRAHVAIAPMRSGSGIQNKVLEAMACGLPVVATTLGLGSIRARVGQELVVADTEAEFSAAVAQLLDSPARAAEIGRRARAFVTGNHSWSAGAAQIEQIYEAILASRSGS
jgi:sugar transferase (PEP-CTERM/EpsH1 system associated)